MANKCTKKVPSRNRGGKNRFQQIHQTFFQPILPTFFNGRLLLARVTRGRDNSKRRTYESLEQVVTGGKVYFSRAIRF